MKNNMDKANVLYIDKEGYERIFLTIEHLKEELRAVNRSRGNAHKSGTDVAWDGNELRDIERTVTIIKNAISINESILQNAIIIEKNNATDTIDLNDILRLSMTYVEDDIIDTEEIIIILVGSAKYDEDKCYIETSINSMVGSLVYGKKIGDEVSYKNGKIDCKIKILEKLNLEQEKSTGITKQLKK